MNMNQWGHEQYMMMPHMMVPNMAPGPGMVQPAPNMAQHPPALLPTPMQPPLSAPEGIVQPLVPPSFMLSEWSQGNPPPGLGGPKPDNFIGPTKPDVDLTKGDDNFNKEGNDYPGKNTRDRDARDGKRDFGDRDRDRGRRPRSPMHRRDNRDRNDRSRGERRERRTQRWSDNKDMLPTEAHPNMPMGNNMMPGLPYGHNMMMGQQQMEMANMPNLMPNMQNIQNIPNMMPGMNMMPNMMPGMINMGMDQNIMMMQMNLNNQPICISSGVLLPPLQNAPMPTRRERPPGCRTIFVGGLPHGVGEDIIREIFERFGIVSDVKLHKQGVCHVRFGSQEQVEQSFFISGFRFKRHDQMDNEATTIFIDFALNREDQTEFERNKRKRTPTPPRMEPYSPATFAAITEKIKSDTEFGEAAPTLVGWLERGECNKKNANAFYSLIQASNNQTRRLYSDKMAIDEEYQNVKTALKDKFATVITQFEQVGKILTAAKMQRVSDHFSKQQRRNIEMWLKMTEDLDNIKEEFNAMFDEDEADDKNAKGSAIFKKYDELRVECENLQYELEGYRNEAHLAKDEAERKFEKFKAHFIAQQALQNKPGHQQVYPPLPPAPEPGAGRPAPPVSPTEAKLISILTAFLLVHPLGASLEYLVSYVRSIIPATTQALISNVLQKYGDVFSRQMTSVGGNIESKWTFVTYDVIKKEVF